MGGKRAAAEPRSRASDRELTQDQRERAADKRQVRADGREYLADQREHLADERESAADERESAADRRESAADEREAVLTERQRGADERERKLDRQTRAVGLTAASANQRTFDDIERSRALLAQSGQRLDRLEAAAARAEAGRQREQAQIDRASAEGTRGLIAQPPDPSQQIERAKALRRRTVALIAAFAASETEIALLHEEMAASNAAHRGEYRQTAVRARESARRAREILEAFPD